MIRLTVFLSFLLGLALILSLNTYRKLPARNEPFNMALAEKMHIEEVKLAQEAKAHSGDEQHKEEIIVEEAEEAAPAIVEVVIPLDTEELKSGYQIYHTKAKCLTCHGKNAEGKKSQQAPKLAGQHGWYLYDQLVKFKNKTRINKVMDPYIKNLTDKDFQDLAAYLSKLPPQ